MRREWDFRICRECGSRMRATYVYPTKWYRYFYTRYSSCWPWANVRCTGCGHCDTSNQMSLWLLSYYWGDIVWWPFREKYLWGGKFGKVVTKVYWRISAKMMTTQHRLCLGPFRHLRTRRTG